MKALFNITCVIVYILLSSVEIIAKDPAFREAVCSPTELCYAECDFMTGSKYKSCKQKCLNAYNNCLSKV
jgi:hypothetical protein